MDSVGIRSSKACENCRRIKKRCRPPFPCLACRQSNSPCVVRSKARPHRRPKSIPEQQLSPAAAPNKDSSLTLTRGKFDRDPYEIIKLMVAQIATDRYGYVLVCDLREPQPEPSRMLGTGRSKNLNQPSHQISHLAYAEIERMLDAAISWNGAPLAVIDIPQLKKFFTTIFAHVPANVSIETVCLEVPDESLDQVALLFATLALQSHSEACDELSAAFYDLASRNVSLYTGESTLNLLCALYLQQLYVLRNGTANQCRSLLAHAVQVAEDLKTTSSEGSEGIRFLRLYLMLHFSDQYCAQTHGTAPCIKISDHQPEIFAPLELACPTLRRLIQMVLINGKSLQMMHKETCTFEDTLEIEAMTGKLCNSVLRPDALKWHTEVDFDVRFEHLANIHIYWCRLILRMPLLLSDAHWISSLSICLRASQRILSIYLDIFCPAIRAIHQTGSINYNEIDKRYLQEATRLPLTWRQVRRITTAAFMVFYSLWKGEISSDEAGQGIATALLLLSFQSLRWGRQIASAISSLQELAAFSNLSLQPYVEKIVPNATQSHIDAIIEHSVVDSHTTNYDFLEHGNYNIETDRLTPAMDDILQHTLTINSILGTYPI